MESGLQSRVLKYLNSLPGCIAENVSGNASQSGRADINGCFRGRSFRIELKIPDNRNKASLKQEINLRKWKSAGAVVVVAYSLEFVKGVFRLNWDTPVVLVKLEKNGCSSNVIIPTRSGKDA